MPYTFKDKVAVVTGGSSGIGKQTALQLAEQGAYVYITARSDRLKEEEKRYVREKGLNIYFRRMDVSREEEVSRVIDDIIREKDRIDILVHSAGIAQNKGFFDMTYEDWKEMININLNGSFLVIKAVTRYMAERRYGKIVIISSGSAITGTGGGIHYTASKAGQIGLMKGLAKELAKFNINVNAIGPRSIDTPMLAERYSDESMMELVGRIPMGRLGTCEDVANLALFLASDESSFITGQFILVDGGRTFS